MRQSIVHIALVVRDYDEAIEFYTKKLHFTLVEDIYQPQQDKRWVVVAPPGSVGTTLLLARASKPEQDPFIGRQTGGRVFLFLNTDDFWRDYNDMVSNGIEFVREPKTEPYGIVAAFKDLYGNLWDPVSPDWLEIFPGPHSWMLDRTRLASPRPARCRRSQRVPSGRGARTSALTPRCHFI